jgi:hypothetical protein
MFMAKKKLDKGTIGELPKIKRVRVSILDGTGKKDVYVAKITVYGLEPREVEDEVRSLLTVMAGRKNT